MASLISKVVVWLAWSRVRVSSQRRWWCLYQACFAIADFSVSLSSCGCLVLLQRHLQCPLCFPNVLLPTTAGDLVNYSKCFQYRDSVLDSVPPQCKIKNRDSALNAFGVVYEIPCSCGQKYIGETKRALEVHLKEHQLLCAT